MSKSRVLDEICEVLDTYKGRDKFLRTICYSTKLIGGLTNNPVLAERMKNVSSQMSQARLILRLLDDLPMLKYTLDYGLGKEEMDQLLSSMGVATNIIDQLYYPIEKMAWMVEHKLISGYKLEPWDIASSIFWATSIFLTLLKTLRYLRLSQLHRNCDDNELLKKLIARRKYEYLTCIRLSLDFIHAVNTLPPGFLWSSKLKTWHVGFVATISSCLGLYQLFTRRSLG